MTAFNTLSSNTNSAAGVQQSQQKAASEKELHAKQNPVDSLTTNVASMCLVKPSANISNAAAPMPKTVSVVKLTQAQVKEILINETVKTMQAIAQDNFNRLQSFHKDSNQLRGGIFYANSFAQSLKQVNTAESLAIWTTLREKGHFFIGLAPEKYFDYVPNKRAPFYSHVNVFVVKKGVKPSEALDAIVKGPSLLACGEVCQIARYQALRVVLKDEKFDQLFANDGKNLNPFKIGFTDALNAINFVTFGLKRNDIQKGDLVHIANIPNQHVKHANGEAGGFNLICSKGGQSPKYLGFGLDPKGLTAAQVGEELLKAYNADPIDDQLILTEKDVKAIFQYESNQEASERRQLAKDKIKLNRFKKNGGGQIIRSACSEFDVIRVMLLAAATIDQGRQLLQKWAEIQRKVTFGS